MFDVYLYLCDFEDGSLPKWYLFTYRAHRLLVVFLVTSLLYSLLHSLCTLLEIYLEIFPEQYLVSFVENNIIYIHKNVHL